MCSQFGMLQKAAKIDAAGNQTQSAHYKLLILDQYEPSPASLSADFRNLFTFSCSRIVQAMDFIVVGGRAESKKSYKTLWQCCPRVLRNLLVIVFLCRMKIFRIVILVIVAALAGGCQKKEEKVEAAPAPVQASTDLPVMAITFLNGNTVQATSLKGSFILILFQPDCDHCQREAQEFQKNLAAFTNYNLYFVSSVGIPETEAFAKQYGLSGHDNVKFGVTPVQSVLDNFGAISAPSIYIYNGSGKLVKKFNGETDIQQIIEAI
jgi:peroxiredoxin